MTDTTGRPEADPAPPHKPGPSRWAPHPAQHALLRSRPVAASPGSNCVFAYRVTGSLHATELAAAYSRALGEFDALRMRLRGSGTQQYWTMDDGPRVDVRLSRPQPSDDPGSVAQQIAMIATRRFDLEYGPLGVVDILTYPTGLVVVVALDHAVADGRSLHLLHRRVRDTLTDAPTSHLRPGHYSRLLEAAERQRNHDINYWRDVFAGFDPPRPDLPARRNLDGPTERVLHLSPERTASLETAARQARATPAGAVLAALTHAVARYRATGELAVLAATDCRPAAHHDTFGQATRLLPVRASHRWQDSVAAHARMMTRALLHGREHPAIDLDELDRCGAPVALSAQDAIAFIYQHDPVVPPRLPDTDTEVIPVPDLHHAGGLTCVVHRLSDGTSRIAVRADAAAVDHRHLHTITDTTDAFLLALTTQPDLALGADELLPREAVHAVTALATPHQPYPFTAVDERILARLRASNGIVLEHGHRYSARDLLATVELLGTHLADAGVMHGDAVIVPADADTPTFHRIAAFIAILHHGAIYVPLDAPAPQHQTIEQLRSTRRTIWQLHGHHLRLTAIGDDPHPSGTGPRPHDPAYVIFTSGTTGTPKGVLVSRFNIANLVAGEGDRFDLTTDSRVLLIAPPTTDPWICHVGATLSHGATLIIADPRDGIEESLSGRRVTHAFLPAALTATLNPDHEYPALTVIATAGDRCRTEAMHPLHRPGRRVFNIYGPTETTVTATVCELDADDAEAPIGRPIRGMGARITIDRRAAAPPGVAGELMLTGAGVALGYLGDPASDMSPFSDDPVTGQRWYATGDRAWLGTDGLLYFAGRSDRQIKIRGFRIELGHIEQTARRTGMCADAAAIAAGHEPHRHIALYVEGCPSTEELRHTISTEQPPHLRPHTIKALDELPRTRSGAVDTRALARNHAHSPGIPGDYPGTGLPERFTRAWVRVLGAVPQPDSDFFDSGGDSLDVLRFVRTARDLDLAIEPSIVYATSRAADMARQLTARPESTGDYYHDDTRSAGFGPAQAWLATLALPQPRRWNQQYVINLSGRHDPDDIVAAWQQLIDRTPILSATVQDRRFCFGPPAAVLQPVLCRATDSDARIRDGLEQIHDSLDPQSGKMLRCMLIQTDTSTTLVVAAHHLVVDDWSWPLIEHRMREALHAGPPRHRPDHGYHHYAATLSQRPGTDTQTRPWTDTYARGRCAELHNRPARLDRQIVDLPRTSRHRDAAHLLAAFGCGLAHIEPHDTSVIDIERNGRTALPTVDLSDAVGWFALHHPVALDHRLDHHHHRRALTTHLSTISDSGLSYGLARWVHREFDSTRIGRFAVNITDNDSVPTTADDPLTQQLRRCAVPLSGTNTLPYEATLILRFGPHKPQLELHHDPSRMPTRQARTVLTETARAYDHTPQHPTS